MSYLGLPKTDKEGVPYLSYSQKKKWKTKNRDYIRQYFFGEKQDNPLLKVYGDFGHKVGESYENNDFSGWNKREAAFLKKLPAYDEFEREIKLQMDGFYMLGFIDSNTAPDGYVKKILDYKTGDIDKGVEEYEAEDYDQTEIYSAALEQEFGQMPDESIVVLIGRVGNAFNGEELKLNRKHEIIQKPLSRERIDEVKQNLQECAEEIADYYRVFNLLKEI